MYDVPHTKDVMGVTKRRFLRPSLVLSAAASLTEPSAAEFPPLRNGALGSLAVAVLPVFLTLRPLASPVRAGGLGRQRSLI